MIEYIYTVDDGGSHNMLTYTTSDCLSDDLLIKEAQSGNRQAMECIILRYKGLVNAVASKYYAVGFEKDDIIQEGMLGLYSAVLDYKFDKKIFKSFACLCITRRIISLLKSSSRQKHIPLNSSISLNSIISEDRGAYLIDVLTASDKTNPEAILISKEEYSCYTEKINSNLSRFELRVLSFYIDGFSYKAISEILRKDVKSVDNAVQRIRKKLEPVLGMRS